MNAVALAKWVVTKCSNDGIPITNLQLQKILCEIQKAHLEAGKMAFYDPIKRFGFGDAVPEVYYRFCGHGATPIDEKYVVELAPNANKIIVETVTEDLRKKQPWE